MRRLALAIATSLCATACGLFVGYDDYHPEGESSSTGSSSGSGGVGASGGAGAGATGSGAAGTGGAGGNACGAGLVLCGSECVNPAVDQANCGECGSVCSTIAPSTAVCEAGKCLVTLAAVPGAVADFAVDGTSVYWTDSISNKVMKVSTEGGTPVTLATTNVPGMITVNATNVFWEADSNGSAASIQKMGLDGSSPGPVLAMSGQLWGLAVDSTFAFYSSGYTLSKVSLAGGSPVQLASNFDYMKSLALDTSTVYFTFGGEVQSIPKAGGTVTKLAWNQGAAAGIGVTATHVYWDSGKLMRVALGGGAWEEVAQWPAQSFVIDKTYAYANSNSELQKVPLAGGAPVTIRPAVATAPKIDGTSIYWAENGGGLGKVMKLTPK